MVFSLLHRELTRRAFPVAIEVSPQRNRGETRLQPDPVVVLVAANYSGVHEVFVVTLEQNTRIKQKGFSAATL